MCLDHQRRVFGGLCHCEKFGWFQCNSSDNNAGFDILRARLKNTYTCPQNQGFGEFQPPLWQHCQRDPTKHVMFR